MLDVIVIALLFLIVCAVIGWLWRLGP